MLRPVAARRCERKVGLFTALAFPLSLAFPLNLAPLAPVLEKLEKLELEEDDERGDQTLRSELG